MQGAAPAEPLPVRTFVPMLHERPRTPVFALPPLPKAVAAAASSDGRLPVVGPDPSWKPFQHAGLLRDIGGMDGWKKVFVHKTHRLPDEVCA